MLKSQQSPDDGEIAHPEIGGPTLVLSAEVPIRSSLFAPLRRLVRKERQERLVYIPWGRAVVHVPEDDAGSVEVWLSVVNMADRSLRVDQLHVEQFTAGGIAISHAVPLFSPPRRKIARRSIAEISFQLPLAAPAIGRLLRSIQSVQNAYPSPNAELVIGGRLTVVVAGSLTALQRKKTVHLPFNVALQGLKLDLSCPGARRQPIGETISQTRG